MKKPGVLLTQMLVLLGYSIGFIVLGEFIGDDAIGPQWAILIIHFLILLVAGIVYVRDAETKQKGKQYFIASILVLLIGHGLCFFNGLLHFNMH